MVNNYINSPPTTRIFFSPFRELIFGEWGWELKNLQYTLKLSSVTFVCWKTFPKYLHLKFICSNIWHNPREGKKTSCKMICGCKFGNSWVSFPTHANHFSDFPCWKSLLIWKKGLPGTTNWITSVGTNNNFVDMQQDLFESTYISFNKTSRHLFWFVTHLFQVYRVSNNKLWKLYSTWFLR